MIIHIQIHKHVFFKLEHMLDVTKMVFAILYTKHEKPDLKQK